MVLALLSTPPTASNVPSDAGEIGGFAEASIDTEPPAVIFAPPVTSVVTVGVIRAWALKPLTVMAPPVSLLVDASASDRPNACAVMLPLVLMIDDAPPKVRLTDGLPVA